MAANGTGSTDQEEAQSVAPDLEASTFQLKQSEVSDEEIWTQNNANKIRDAVFHAVAMALVTVIVVPLARRTSLTAENIIGIAFLFIYGLYLGHVWWLLLRADGLYRIYTVSGIPDQWAPMSIAYKNKPHYENPIESISEFSAIAGGVAKTLLARVGTMTWGILMTLIMVQVKNDAITVRWSLLMECVGAFGIDLIGTFYDDPKSRGMRIGHYTGVGLAVFCLIGLWMQRFVDLPAEDRSAGAGDIVMLIALSLVFLVFFLLFMLWDKISPLVPSPTKEVITKRSRLVIGFETAGLGALSLSFCLYFILYPPHK